MSSNFSKNCLNTQTDRQKIQIVEDSRSTNGSLENNENTEEEFLDLHREDKENMDTFIMDKIKWSFWLDFRSFASICFSSWLISETVSSCNGPPHTGVSQAELHNNNNMRFWQRSLTPNLIHHQLISGCNQRTTIQNKLIRQEECRSNGDEMNCALPSLQLILNNKLSRQSKTISRRNKINVNLV